MVFLHCWIQKASGFHCKGWFVCTESARWRGTKSRGASGCWEHLESACSSTDRPLVPSWSLLHRTAHCHKNKDTEIVPPTAKQRGGLKENHRRSHTCWCPSVRDRARVWRVCRGSSWISEWGRWFFPLRSGSALSRTAQPPSVTSSLGPVLTPVTPLEIQQQEMRSICNM